MSAAPERQFVWDIPTRVFHWLLVILIGFSWWSAENHKLQWHLWSGYWVCALIVFRILWGFFGTSTARFSQFLKGPGAIRAYLRSDEASAAPGHNPLGGWSVFALLLVLAVQVTTGLFAQDTDGLEYGPLNYLVTYEQGSLATDIHEISFKILQILIILHIAAVFFYLIFKRRNLIGAMITGHRRSEGDTAGAVRVPVWRLIVAILIAAAVAYYVSNGLSFTKADVPPMEDYM